MIKILITGTNSYIGTSFNKWVSQYPDKYFVETISVRNDHWKERSFADYDVVLHTAAIVHVKENDTDKYFKVNRDLAVEVAEKAKHEGVKQFVFLSTMGVYGTETGHITKTTRPDPKTYYAKSKYDAEQSLKMLATDEFKIAILRPPLVYGRGCKGNYQRLVKISLRFPFFPRLNNKRSIIYIDNLSEFIKVLIDECSGGLFFPQNKDYLNTTALVELIAEIHGKRIVCTQMFNWIIPMLMKVSGSSRKVFGSFYYDKDMDKLDREYNVQSFKDSIVLTESG